MKLKLILVCLFVGCIINFIDSASVCNAQMLIDELIQDLADNNKLDCLLEPLPAPRDRRETPEETAKRIRGAWDTDCAFQASYDWFSIARDRFGIRTGLVDKDGKATLAPLDDQADICELIRSMVFAGLFENIKLETLTEDAFDSIRCVGPADNPEYQICAATGDSASLRSGWLIMLDPTAMTMIEVNARPKWELEKKSKDLLDLRADPSSQF
jgi:hypothetical protein